MVRDLIANAAEEQASEGRATARSNDNEVNVLLTGVVTDGFRRMSPDLVEFDVR